MPDMFVREFLVILLLFGALPLRAVERYLRVDAPATVRAEQNFRVTISASTDAGEGEQVGMFQADLSSDGGRTWTPVRYLDGLGASTKQDIDLKAGPANSAVRLRVRVAFRGGLAGDVDFRGAAIRWHESWGRWAEPPAQSVAIAVTAP